VVKYALIGRDERHGYLLDALRKEGHEVKMLSRARTGAWDGMLDRLSDLQSLREWGPDLVLVDSPGFGPLIKTLGEEGFRVFGGSKLADRLDGNYLYGLSILEGAGVPTVEHSRFTDVTDAVDYTMGKQQPWALRTPDGTFLNFKDTPALQLHLEKLYTAGGPSEFALQRGYPDVSSDGLMLNPMYYLVGLYNSTGLMSPCFRMSTAHNLLPHSMGVPSMEGVSLKVESLDSSAVESTLLKMQKALGAVNFTGWVFLGCLEEWDKDEGYTTKVLDFRVSAPDGFWAALLQGLNMSFEHFLDRVMNPRRPNTPFEFQDGCVVSRKVSLPPYPLTQARWVNKPLQDLLPDISWHRSQSVYWVDVKSLDGMLTPSGPVVGYVAARGRDSGDALHALGLVVNTLNIPYMQVKVEDGMDCLHLDLLQNGRTM